MPVTCRNCGIALSNDEVALGVKLCGLAAPLLRCFGCAAADLGTNAEELRDLAAWFRETGCEAFQRDYLS